MRYLSQSYFLRCYTGTGSRRILRHNRVNCQCLRLDICAGQRYDRRRDHTCHRDMLNVYLSVLLDVKQLVDTHARSISTRNYYLEHFPEISHQAILRKEQGLGPFDPVSIDDASKIGNGPAINPEGYAKPGTPMDVMANSEAIGNEDSSSKPDGPHNQGQTENPSKDIIASPGEPENSAEPMDVEQVEEMSAQR